LSVSRMESKWRPAVPAAKGLLDNNMESDFNLIQLVRIGESEMHLHADVRSWPALHRRMLVGGVVVHDQVDGEETVRSLVET
jgi:hypothetical protein